MAHHIRQVADVDLPTDEGRSLAGRELGNEGLFRIGTDPATGDGIYTVPCVDPCDNTHPGIELVTGFLNERYQSLPPALIPHVFRADVFRSILGNVNLRRVLETALGKTIPAGKLADQDVLDEARRRTEGNNPSAERRRVPRADIGDGDIVETENQYPRRVAGEISIR